MGTAWIVVILCFLSYAFVHVISHPNQAPSDSEFTWSAKNSDDDVDDFRSFSDGPLPSVAEFDEIENEYKADEVDFDEEDDGYFELTNNKRSPHPASDRSFKNKQGYYLIEDLHHKVVGTKDRVKCNTNGVFRVGKINGIPYIKNKVTGRYLAINDSGHVYTTVTKGTDTAIRIYVTQTLQVYLYRILKNPKRYLYLDISPQSQTVTPNNLGDTALFQVRLGNTC